MRVEGLLRQLLELLLRLLVAAEPPDEQQRPGRRSEQSSLWIALWWLLGIVVWKDLSARLLRRFVAVLERRSSRRLSIGEAHRLAAFVVEQVETLATRLVLRPGEEYHYTTVFRFGIQSP